MTNYSRRFDINQAIKEIKSDIPYFSDKTYSKYDAEEIIDHFHKGKSLELTLKDDMTGNQILETISDLNRKQQILNESYKINDMYGNFDEEEDIADYHSRIDEITDDELPF